MKIIYSVCVRLIHLNSANKAEVEVEVKAQQTSPPTSCLLPQLA